MAAMFEEAQLARQASQKGGSGSRQQPGTRPWEASEAGPAGSQLTSPGGDRDASCRWRLARRTHSSWSEDEGLRVQGDGKWRGPGPGRGRGAEPQGPQIPSSPGQSPGGNRGHGTPGGGSSPPSVLLRDLGTTPLHASRPTSTRHRLHTRGTGPRQRVLQGEARRTRGSGARACARTRTHTHMRACGVSNGHSARKTARQDAAPRASRLPPPVAPGPAWSCR